MGQGLIELVDAGKVVRIGDRVWEREPVYGLILDQHYARLDFLGSGVRAPLSDELFSDRMKLFRAGVEGEVEDIFRIGGERLGEFVIVEPHAGGLSLVYFRGVRPHYRNNAWRADVTRSTTVTPYVLSHANFGFNKPSVLSPELIHDCWGDAAERAGGFYLREGQWPVGRDSDGNDVWRLDASGISGNIGSRWVGDAKNFDKKLLAKIERLA